ncbi:MAG: AbrB/MazE/SpoVT family DNA-binding domain-containing protein [Lachnospiraceae bacterium]|nr:AbrB/MazE/SpoVT family DNA-binding domain-containing protein [Lachnospiraceae bacterium]
MELAKVTSKGQVTIPVAIRKMLGIREGDKLLFVEEGKKVVLMNASTNALLKAQEAFEGVAEELGIKNEQDVVNLVKEIRAERGEQYKCE